MKSIIYITAACLSLGLVAAVTIGSTKSQDRYGDWRRSSDIEDRRDDAAMKGDLAPGGWAVYHRNHH